MKKFIIIGSGLFGCVLAERIANGLNAKVHVFEKRGKVGGNCSDKEINDISVCEYGAHIFHTSNKTVWEYIKHFAEFNNYRHKVLVNYKNKLYPIPINLLTLNMVCGKCLFPCQINACLKKYDTSMLEGTNFKKSALKAVGKRFYKMFYEGYTKKQWGMDPKKLPASIFQRIPVRYTYDTAYFNDIWEGMPVNGYSAMFKAILQSKKIKVTLNEHIRLCTLPKDPKTIIIYTGKLDEAFNYRYGELGWRSSRFDTYQEKINDYQGTSVINYTEESIPYIRSIEHKHFYPEKQYNKGTVITYEYPINNNKEPYYPINTLPNNLLYSKYRKDAIKMKNFYYGGRLADYKYYDMDDTIFAALNLYERIKKDLGK